MVSWPIFYRKGLGRGLGLPFGVVLLRMEGVSTVESKLPVTEHTNGVGWGRQGGHGGGEAGGTQRGWR